MQLTDLMDKHQQVQIAIFQKIISSDTTVSIRGLTRELEISLPTLQKEIRDLEDSLQLFSCQSELQRLDNDQLTLKLPADFSVKKFIYSYLEQAPDYQILNFIFQHKKVSITKMTLDLQMSEAKIFRRLKAINLLLQEYEIQFRNKQLVGEEIQIRIFFYHLFFTSLTVEKIEMTFENPTIHHLVRVLEKQFSLTFSREQLSQLTLWLSIMQKRLDYQAKPIFRFDFETIRRFEQDNFYQGIKNILARYFSRFAIQWTEEEAVFLYLFFLSEGLIPFSKKCFSDSPFIADFLESNQLIYEAITDQSKGIDDFQAFLLKLHVKLRFYKGWIDPPEDSLILLSDLNAERLSRCMTIIEEKISKSISDSQWKVVDQMYGLLLDIYQRRQIKRLRIGIALDDSLQAEEVFQFIQQHLVSIPHIRVEKARNKTYALLITKENVDVAFFSYEHLFLLSGQGSMFEVNRLKQTIQQLFE